MSLQSDVRDLFTSQILESDLLSAMTSKRYNFDIVLQSGKQAAQIRHSGQVNFITITVIQLPRVAAMMNAEELTIQVAISIYVAADPKGENFNVALDRLVEVSSYIKAQLGTSWRALVDYSIVSGETSPIEEVTIDGAQVWRAREVLLGFRKQ